MRKIKFLVPTVLVCVLVVFAGCSDSAAKGNAWKGSGDRAVETGRGRAAADGKERGVPEAAPASLTRLEGKLVYDDPEWLLDTGDESVALFLGNRTFLESLDIELKEGTEVVAFGIMEDDGLSVARIITEDGEIVLRSDTGVPQWAGNGNRGQRQTATAEGSQRPAEGGRFQGAGEGGDRPAGRGEGRGQGRGNGSGRGGGQRAGSGAGPAA